MGHDVRVVDDAIPLRHFRGEESSEGLIAHSGLTERVELVHPPEDFLEIQGSDRGQGAPQRESGHVDLGALVGIEKSLHILPNVALDTLEGIVEALVDEAAATGRVLDFGGIEIGNPVLDVDGAPESHKHCILLLGVAGEPVDVQDWVRERAGLTYHQVVTFCMGSKAQYLHDHLEIYASLAQAQAEAYDILRAIVVLQHAASTINRPRTTTFMRDFIQVKLIGGQQSYNSPKHRLVYTVNLT